MPSSQNRRRIEIPLDLYHRLAHQAETEHTTVSALATHLLGHTLAQDSMQRDEQRRLYEQLDCCDLGAGAVMSGPRRDAWQTRWQLPRRW